MLVATPARAKDHIKYIDENGVVTWVEDKSKIPPNIPAQIKYEDNNGITFWVDNVTKIPPEYRNKPANKEVVSDKIELEAVQSAVINKKYSTKISIVDNVIIVPVVFRNKGRKVKARMILDTGASVTTIYSVLASQLNLNKNKLSMARAINANGVYSDSVLTKVDHIEVDDKILSNAEIIVVPSHTNIGADGLLGNSFLRFFNFTIDYEKQLLLWN
jgi:hypothetical protein